MMAKKNTESELIQEDEIEVLSPESEHEIEIHDEGEETTLVPVGPLQRYLAEVRKHSLLTPEEEYKLAVEFKDKREPSIAWRLVTANLRLVVKIALEYQRAFINTMDLIQEGNIGLMQAVDKFDPTRGVKLSSYASWWIKAYILRFILNNRRMVKIGTTQAQRKLFFNLQKEKDRLEALGYSPSPKLIASRLDVSEDEVIEMDRRLGQGELSLDMPVQDDGKSSLGDTVAATMALQDDAIADRQLKGMYHEALNEYEKTLNEKEKFIFRNRLLTENPMTLQEIGDHFGLTRERVRQIENRIIKKLREFFRQKQLTPPEDFIK